MSSPNLAYEHRRRVLFFRLSLAKRIACTAKIIKEQGKKFGNLNDNKEQKMSNISWLAKFGDLLALPVEDHAADPSRSSYERFAIPHTFKPQLSVAQATVAAGGALLRIVLGSLLFAVWGAYTFLAWNALPNVFLRGLMALVSVTLFLVLLAGLMIAISALTRMIWPQRQRTTA